MSTENNTVAPEREIASTIKDSVKEGVADVSKGVEDLVNEVKNLQDFQKAKIEMEAEIKSFKDSVEKKSAEEVKSLSMEVEALKSKEKKSHSAFASQESVNEVFEKEVKSFKDPFINSIANKTMARFDINDKESKSIFNEAGFIDLQKKSLVTYDNAIASQLLPEQQRLGLLDVNFQTLSPITSLVQNISAGSIVKGLAYDTIDSSNVEIFEGNEGTAAKNTSLPKYDEINIHVAQYKARFLITDRMLHSVSEFRFNPIQIVLQKIESRFEKNIARNILNGGTVGENSQGVLGILPIAQKQARKNNIRVVDTKAVNALTLPDLRNLGKTLKEEYLRDNNAVIIMDKQAFYSVASEEGNDGHLKEEYFATNDRTGIISLKTPSGTVRIVLVEDGDGFVNYPNFDNGTNVTEGFVEDGANTGKAVAILGNLRAGYTLARSSVVQMGYTADNISEFLEKGYIYAGKYGYIGGNVTVAESMAVLKIK